MHYGSCQPTVTANGCYCNSEVFQVIFDTILFLSVSSTYIYIQRREYRIECYSCLLRVEIRNTSDFMGLWILAEMGWWCHVYLSFSFQPTVYPIFDNIFNRTTSMKFVMQLPNNILQGHFTKNSGKSYFFRSIFLLFESTWTLVKENIAYPWPLFGDEGLTTDFSPKQYSLWN